MCVYIGPAKLIFLVRKISPGKCINVYIRPTTWLCVTYDSLCCFPEAVKSKSTYTGSRSGTTSRTT